MALNFTGFKQKLFDAEKMNESSNAYQLSYAGGTSGWSYGWLQFDLSRELEIGLITFQDILEIATDTNGKIVPENREDELYKAAKSRGGTGLTGEQKQLINRALSSAHGKQAIDDATSERLDDLIAYADALTARAPGNALVFRVTL